MTKKKKFFLVIFVVLSIILLCSFIFIFSIKMIQKYNFEKSFLNEAQMNTETIFSVKNIVFFSGVDVKNRTSSVTNFTIENLFQYTDMAIFIDNHINTNENNLKNTLKALRIENINFTKLPELGNVSLYYRNFSDFAKSSFSEDKKIEKDFSFLITADEQTTFEEPYLYNTCANPITLTFENSNIKTDYTITDTSIPITYDGTLLKRCNVLLSSISCAFSFDIIITNNLDQEFKCTVFIDIPLEDTNSSILDGKIITKKELNSAFYRYK